METLSKSYDPTEVEAKWYPIWLREKLFEAQAPSNKTAFTIAMPPPNVTGSLHMGHALTATIEDTLVRYNRMMGKNALWIPGTDHAGIATQMVVERELKKEGKSRHDMGREKFLERVWEWKEKYGSRIEEQHRVLGASCDWSRNNFTMSPKLNRAVREVFVRMHEEGLIYRDERLINWCPRCLTALSDLEVEHGDPKKGHMWHLRYPVKDQPGRFVVVATTRPETMLGDTAVAVHSSDARYKDLHGARLLLPLTGRDIPIVVDDVLVDPEFGSGAVKVTPGHDFNDFQTGKRNNLPVVSVLNETGHIDLVGSEFHGLERFAARKAIVARLEQDGLLERIEDHTLTIAHCSRCATVLEPRVSLQWYVRMETLAKPALQAVTSGEVKILPDYWVKTYEHWMTNIQDWCVSRQLWWGHQIPAYYCEDKHVTVAREKPDACATCGKTQLTQDQDVLDTWFSSGLWPFSTLGWPDKTPDLDTFYPNSVMETGSDILFFWVARMMMFGIHFMGKPPFKTIYLHSMVRDEHGKKMSKTSGNVIDPLDIVYGVSKDDVSTKLPKSQHKALADGLPPLGADALRFTLATMSAAGRDIKLSFEAMQGYRAFCNKLWNATRFALMNFEEGYVAGNAIGQSLADKWILSRLEHTVQKVHASLAEFQFSDASLALYHFVWNELCDWYLELTKLTLKDDATRRSTQDTLVHVLEQSFRLLHPFMPFITEELWQALPRNKGSETYLATAAYPQATGKTDAAAEKQVAVLIDAITALRNIRGEQQLPPSKEFYAELHATDDVVAALQPNEQHIRRLANITLAFKAPGSPRPAQVATCVMGSVEAVVPLEGLLDFAKEEERLRREMGKLTAELEKATAKLGNEAFTAKAPPQVVAELQARKEEMLSQLSKLKASYELVPASFRK